MLSNAYKQFQVGNDKESIELAIKVLEIGKKINNDTLVGKALTSLCRNSQRKLDTIRLAELSEELINLSNSSGDKQWIMYQAHMNAEMWRLIGNMDKAESYYNQSMEISNEIGAKGMYMIDHFNKSFVATTKGNFNSARNLINKYYQLRKEMNRNPEDAYGLIALAFLLEKEGNYEGAYEVCVVARRLFNEQNIFPEPPDEKPLFFVEKICEKKVDKRSRNEIIERSYNESVNSLLERYLN
tara:strand:+ start:192 stop:914 length:723 start_codon:yes stop_codon:yes gene_type:complete